MSISAAPRQDLAPIIEKVSAGERLTLEDGLTLYNSPDLLTIAQLANQVNLSKNGISREIASFSNSFTCSRLPIFPLIRFNSA